MKTLVVLSHSYYAHSRFNRALREAAQQLPDVEFRHLEELYGDRCRGFDLDAEHAAIDRADRVVLQFPILWFSMPPMMKAWLDEVLCVGWAIGDVHKMAGKDITACVSSDVTEAIYHQHMDVSIEDFLIPLRLSARSVRCRWCKPMIFDGAMHCTEDERKALVARYAQWLEAPWESWQKA